MAGVLAFQGYLRVLKDNGDVCADAKAAWYVAGTTTPADTYTTSALSVANANPVEASALGIFPEMWLSPTVSYKVVITGTGVTTRTIDNVYGALTINQLENDVRYIGVPGGAAYTTTGSSNAYVVSTGLALTALPAFSTFLVKANFTNTGAATLNVDGIGAKSITRGGANPLPAGAMLSGNIYEVSYDGTQFQLMGSALAGAVKGRLFGLTLSNNASDATNDIDISEGEAADGGGALTITLATGITKRLDAAWAVGTNQGGLDTGSIANGTYHVWLIMRSDTGVVDVLFSTSATSPTMPSNYDYKRRIGSIIRSGGSILAFTQRGDDFRLSASVLDINAASSGTSAVTRTLTVPTGIVVFPHMMIGVTAGAAGGNSVKVSALTETDETPSSTNNQAFSLGATTIGPTGREDRVATNTSAQVRSRDSNADQTTRIRTLGWTDTRGRLAS